MRIVLRLLALLLVVPGLALGVTWKDIPHQSPDWYAGPESREVLRNVIAHQTSSGGWPKNRDLTKPPGETLPRDGQGHEDLTWATIDNGATVQPLRFLARMIAAGAADPARDSWDRGFEYLLEAQYENGGWPQFYPVRKGYYTHITFNDDAMVNVLRLLHDVAKGEASFDFCTEEQRERARGAVTRGIACILACQVKVAGVPTVWCAQHDEVTFEPAAARRYELVSLSGLESVNIVRFLMEAAPAEANVRASVKAAVEWFRKTALRDIRIRKVNTGVGEGGYDLVVEDAPGAAPVWARFYEIGTNRPFFCGRDGIKRYALSDIERERRVGYAWYTEAPARLLEEYAQWEKLTAAGP